MFKTGLFLFINTNYIFIDIVFTDIDIITSIYITWIIIYHIIQVYNKSLALDYMKSCLFQTELLCNYLCTAT